MYTHPTHTSAPLLRYLQAEPVVRDHEGRMFSTTDYVLTQPTCMPDQHPDNTDLTPASIVFNLLTAPREQRLSTPPRVPIDHPAVVVIVYHSSHRRVIERGAATVRAVQDFLSNQLYLPTQHLPAEMVREPYFDGEVFDAVSYSEIVTAMGASSDPWGEAVSSGLLDEAEARWVLGDRLQLAVYEIDADRLVALEDVENLPYC